MVSQYTCIKLEQNVTRPNQRVDWKLAKLRFSPSYSYVIIYDMCIVHAHIFLHVHTPCTEHSRNLYNNGGRESCVQFFSLLCH